MRKSDAANYSVNKFRKEVFRIMAYVIAFILICVLVLTGVLLYWSPGKPVPYLDEYGNFLEDSISEKIKVTIGGTEQGMIIRGRNVKNPVILFLHGGPGMPEYFLAEKYSAELEDNFTVCYWEQEGSGLSYSPGMNGSSITAERLISDTIDLTNYLRDRFGQDKIYLVAHSWGTFIGIQAAATTPELYYAYVGIGQISNMIKSERLAYEYMLEQYTAVGNTNMVNKLKKYPVLDNDLAVRSFFESPLRDEAMHELGIGTMHNMKSVISGIFLPVMECRAYTLNEKINIWRAKAFLRSNTPLLDQLFSEDLTTNVPKLDIPVYFLSGKYDYSVSQELSKQYLDALQAPVKGFYSFDQSAHSPIFEESHKFVEILIGDVMTRTNSSSE